MNLLNIQENHTNESNKNKLEILEIHKIKGEAEELIFKNNQDADSSNLPYHHLIIDCSAFNYIDTYAAKTINQVPSTFS